MVKARSQRTVLRWIHVVVGSLLATYAYLPPGEGAWLRWVLMVAGVPALAVTGLWMWKQAAARRFAKKLLPHRFSPTPTLQKA